MQVIALLLAISFSVPVQAEEEETITIPRGGIEELVCIKTGTLSVRSDDLRRVLFDVKRGDPVKSFQGWGEVKKTKTIDGTRFSFIKLQFPDKSGNNIGWVAEEYIKTRAECPGMEADALLPLVEERIASINDPRCCVFPLANRPLVTYTSGVASFGSSRSGGRRKHAAADLYRDLGDSIRAVADGSVIRGLYFFYQGTYAIELKHSGGFVVRYGEIGSKSVVPQGRSVAAGQTIGYLGKTTCCKPMLHFELYSGAKSGPLSGGGVYQRRSDLMNPTAYLKKWQEDAFRDQR
jgi:hypothetical protein